MTTAEKSHPYTLGPDEKAAAVMVYLPTAVCWGEVVVKELIRVSTWLRTNSAPNYLCLYGAKFMNTSSSTPRPISFPTLEVNVSTVMAYHLIPPAQDPLDYDPSEPNRKMEPVTALVGSFRLDGSIRIASISNLARFLEVTKEMFTALYDVDISSPGIQGLGVMKVPFVLVRQANTIFASRA